MQYLNKDSYANLCMCVFLHSGPMWPFGKCGPPMCLFRGPRPNTEVYTSDKINNIENKGARERKTDKSSLKKDKGNWPKGPKVSFCLHLG